MMSLEQHVPLTAIIEKEEIIQYLHPSLLHLDYQRPLVKTAIVLTAVIFYCLVFLCSSLLCRYTHTYRNLRAKEKVFWNLAIIRALFGIFGAVIGEYYKD